MNLGLHIISIGCDEKKNVKNDIGKKMFVQNLWNVFLKSICTPLFKNIWMEGCKLACQKEKVSC